MPLIIVAALAPESPWWLVRKGRIDDAHVALQRLTAVSRDGQQDDFDLNNTISMMQHTHTLEERVSASRNALIEAESTLFAALLKS